ncbi:phosphopantetheine-binding protein [Streptomyces sp. URMC 126]|uniref:phosphopantetheine-binding protein n=1 Tax=Streptomyces sp. URMC 126 TaxID=3423401 RepID=UPI003F1A20E4
MTDYFDRLTRLLTRHFGIDLEDIGEGVALSSLALDSLSLAEFGLIIEGDSGVRLPDEVFRSPRATLGDVARRVRPRSGDDP